MFQGGMVGTSIFIALEASGNWHIVEQLATWQLALDRLLTSGKLVGRDFWLHCFLTTGILSPNIKISHFLRTEKETLLISEEFSKPQLMVYTSASFGYVSNYLLWTFCLECHCCVRFEQQSWSDYFSDCPDWLNHWKSLGSSTDLVCLGLLVWSWLRH